MKKLAIILALVFNASANVEINMSSCFAYMEDAELNLETMVTGNSVNNQIAIEQGFWGYMDNSKSAIQICPSEISDDIRRIREGIKQQYIKIKGIKDGR